MIYVGIDVSKDKHDCCIVNSDGEVFKEVFTIQNNLDGFNLLFQTLQSVAPDLSKVKVGLEATGHYSYNILGFLLDKGLVHLCHQPAPYQSVSESNQSSPDENRPCRCAYHCSYDDVRCSPHVLHGYIIPQ